MANVLNRTTLQYLRSVHTPNYPALDWVINPDLTPVVGVPQKYWKLTGDILSEMTQPEKDAVDAAEAAAVLLTSADAQQAEELKTTSAEYVTVLDLAPTNSFESGTYRVDWSLAVKRQSNRGLIRFRLQVDAVTVFELGELDPRNWLHQTGSVLNVWTEDQHVVELQIASTKAGRSVYAKGAALSVTKEPNNG